MRVPLSRFLFLSRPRARSARQLRLALLLALGACAAAPPAVRPAAPDSMRTRQLAPGVEYRRMWLAQGPWMVHLVEVAPWACGVEFRTAKAQERVVGRAEPREMARRAEAALGRPVLAAINGDFFSYDPAGVPEGPQVSDGEVVKGNGGYREALEDRRLRQQPAFGVAAGTPFLSEAWLAGGLRAPRGFTAPLQRVNPVRPTAELALYNHFIGERTPADTSAVAVTVRLLPRGALDGDSVRGVVTAVEQGGAAIPADGVVLVGRGRGGIFLRGLLAAGDTVAWLLGWSGPPGRPQELLGGYPMLLRSGAPVAEEEGLRPPFSATRHPRSAVALRPDGTVLLVAVDGRAPGHSAGMSLQELAAFLRTLGATEALNLDGGGSTALVLGDSVVSRPSDAAGERPVANALLLLGARPGSCGGYAGASRR